MKKHAGLLMLVLLCSVFLQAESVWTGNVSVGSSLQFPGSREYFRAASNAFPIGTILRVTNPKGKASVDVTVIDRLESPGVFLLMEMKAASRIGIPSDHIRPVQVVPIGSSNVVGTLESLSDSQISASPKDDKTDISADASREEDQNVSRSLILEPTMIDELGEYNRAGETLIPVDTRDAGKTGDEIPIVDQAIPDMEADETGNLIPAEEPVTDEVFFLTPSELRPPEGAAIEATEHPPVKEDGFDIASYKTDDRGKYIQIGAYQSRENFEARVDDIQRSNPDYPLRVATIRETENPDQRVYKLLLGPIKPAEIGVVLDTVRQKSFPDAFPFIGE